jgi:hypothetical protein
MDEYQRLVVAGLDNKTAADVFNKPRRREAALSMVGSGRPFHPHHIKSGVKVYVDV